MVMETCLTFWFKPTATPRLPNAFFRNLVQQFGEPRVVVTDKLHSYIKPIQKQAPDADHRACKGMTDRIESSHRLTRKREKIMGRFKSPVQAQRFLSALDQINNIFPSTLLQTFRLFIAPQGPMLSTFRRIILLKWQPEFSASGTIAAYLKQPGNAPDTHCLCAVT